MTTKPKRKPPLPEMLRPVVAEAIKRNQRRPASPGVAIEPVGDGYGFAPPHRDLDAWEAMICDAFGTRSESTYFAFLSELAALCEGRWTRDHGMCANETKLNAALNIVNSIRPRNEMEAALALQMVAVHFTTMTLAAQVVEQPWANPNGTAMMGKLARTFAMQIDTLARLRGRVGKQTIKVRYERHDHKHVHIGEGGEENGTRAHARRGSPTTTLPPDEVPALPGPNAGGHALPGAGGKRKSPV